MRPRTRLAPAALLLALLATACATPAVSPPGSTPSAIGASSASAGASVPVGLLLSDVGATPAVRTEAAIEVAFDAATAAALVESLPATIDFTSQALVCVFLGSRPTTGWGLTLQSASLRDGVLAIAARETRPGGGARTETTYPADCGLLNRAALPPGPLSVRADDTISDEFITDGEVTVPPDGGAP